MSDSGHGTTPGAGHSKGGGAQGGLLLFGVILLFAFGLAVPAVVLLTNGASKASDGPKGMKLTKEEVAGRELFAKTCVYCHALAAEKSYGRTGPDLDVVLKGLKTPERQAFVEEAIEQGENHGIGQMPALLYQGKEAKEVSKYVAAVAAVGVNGATVEPVGYPEIESKAESEKAIAMERAAEPQPSSAELAKGKEIFTSNCSFCHALANAGSTATVGPDLDRLEPRDAQIEAQVISGGGLMPAFGGKEGTLKPAEIEMVSRYVSAVAGTK